MDITILVHCEYIHVETVISNVKAENGSYTTIKAVGLR
jgi:hypothetical protein